MHVDYNNYIQYIYIYSVDIFISQGYLYHRDILYPAWIYITRVVPACIYNVYIINIHIQVWSHDTLVIVI